MMFEDLNMTDKYKDVFWGEVYSNTPFSNWDFEFVSLKTSNTFPLRDPNLFSTR